MIRICNSKKKNLIVRFQVKLWFSGGVRKTSMYWGCDQRHLESAGIQLTSRSHILHALC